MRIATLLLSGLLFISFVSISQTFSGSFMFDGENREYQLHIPPTPNPNGAPLVIALHGLGDTDNNFMNATGFNAMADTAGFIVVHPQALPDPILFGNAWNNGTNPLSTVDDIGFLNKLIDTISEDYNIDSTRIYATGFSMGGFMCHRLACEMSNRIAAIASISGMLPEAYLGVNNCTPTRGVPVMHMHGNNDATVPYDGSGLLQAFITSVDETVNQWVTLNNTSTTPILDTLPDIASDGYLIWTDHYLYGTDSSEVLLYTIDNGPHTWLQSFNDVYASQEIWKFFNRHALLVTMPQDTTSTAINYVDLQQLTVFPNPANDVLYIKGFEYEDNLVELFSIDGKLLHSTFVADHSDLTISLEGIPSGLVFLKVSSAYTSEIYRIKRQ